MLMARRPHPCSINHHPLQQGAATSIPSRHFSPAASLKRPADRGDREELPSLKRLQSGATIEQVYQFGRRGSIDHTVREPRLGHSPTPTESLPGSAHSRLPSPSLGRYAIHRTLPSPSSLALPAPTAPALPHLRTVQSASPPAAPYQPPSSFHTASSNPATSQHIADLQHQVTLKSLALQTLQSEYASLLQKLQRERVKSHSIEKKTSAADQEVNDLTGKNEDLTEQVKALETQLEESERKREYQRQEAAREKEQWGRMLEMSGRLQIKADAEKQRLLEEKNHVMQRLALYEDVESQRHCEQAKRDYTQSDQPRVDCPGPRPDRHTDVAHRATLLTQSTRMNNSQNANLEQEVVSLRARVNALRVTLEGVRRHNEELETSTRGFLEQTGLLWSNVSRALDDDDDDESQSNRRSNERRAINLEKSAARPHELPESLRQTESRKNTMSTRKIGMLEIFQEGKRSLPNIREVCRAKSAEPQAPGLHVPTATSSPQQLFKALGPVPTTLPPLKNVAPTTSWTPIIPSRQHTQSAEPVSSAGSTLPSGYIGHYRPAESSPRSCHSSNADGNEDGSCSSPETGRGSPEACNSEPEPSTTRPTTSQSVLTPIKPMTTSFHSHPFHGHAIGMPPPPRPEVSYAGTQA